MGDARAMEIAQLWQQYFSPTMGAPQAAGLQIAIWEVVGGSFTLNQANDYGASLMLDWWSRNGSRRRSSGVDWQRPGLRD
jgi:hypothetical protein